MYLSSVPPESSTSSVIGVKDSAELRAGDRETQRERREHGRARARAVEKPACKHVLGERRVQLDTVGERIERRGDLVVRAVREADEHELALELRARGAAIEHVGGR